MKILKIFGIVVGIHLFALILIFANPGCSSTTKTPPSASDTAAKPTAPIATTTSTASTSAAPATSDTSSSSSAITFNPNSPAAAAPSTASEGPRVSPTRPNSPVAGVLAPEPVSGVTPATTYTVKSGDNLWTIAKKHNLTVAQLTAANSISTNTSLHPGQKLIIPSKAASVAPNATATSTPRMPDAPSAAAAKPGEVKHVVKAGETLGGIAKKYDVRQGDIAVANNIVDPAKIRPGMELIIPGYQSPTKSSKSSKSSKAPATSSTPAPLPADPAPSTSSTPPPSTPAVPVIRIDDNPPPAPKL